MARSGRTATEPARSLTDEVIDAFTRRRVELSPGKNPVEAIDELRPLLHGVDLGVHEYVNPLVDVAVLSVRLARLLASGDTSRQFLAQVCTRALAAGGLFLRLSSKEIDELFELALADDPNDPDRVITWLIDRPKVVGDTPRAGGRAGDPMAPKKSLADEAP
jgi:hypothetical protein